MIKTDTNTTTKLRPVFNCSLKRNKVLSLSEAVYAGLSLMKDIIKLSIYFRSNNYTMMSDIKQAFLQIRLARETDKNRFCFFCVLETDRSLIVTRPSSSASMLVLLFRIMF